MWLNNFYPEYHIKVRSWLKYFYIFVVCFGGDDDDDGAFVCAVRVCTRMSACIHICHTCYTVACLKPLI